jgi:hypothetical protein
MVKNDLGAFTKTERLGIPKNVLVGSIHLQKKRLNLNISSMTP